MLASRFETIPVPRSVQDAQSVAQILLSAVLHRPSSGIIYLDNAADGTPEVRSHQSNRQLLDEAMLLTGALHAQGLRPQSKVALLLDDHRDFVTTLWACFLGGFVPCTLVATPADPARWAATLRHVDELLEHPLLITSAATRRALPAVPGLSVVSLDALRADDSAPAPHLAQLDDLALLVLTSGSTGNAKAVTLTHGNLLASMAGKQQTQQLGVGDTTFNWISFDHVAAMLETHLLPLYAGAQQIHAPSELILQNPLEFLRIISRYRVSMTFTPNFLLGQINSLVDAPVATAAERLDLTCLRHIVSGGEANVVATGQRFLDAYAQHGLNYAALWPAFGMTETCAGSIYNREFPVCDAGQEFASVGGPIPGLSVRIADDDGNPLPDGEIGELQVRGDMITRGYYRNDAATAAAFTPDHWFRTGDLGSLDDGRVTLAGRSKDSIIVNGVNYFSHEIETALEELDGVTRGYVAAFPTRRPDADTEQLVIAVNLDNEGDETELHRVMTAVRSTVVVLCGFRPGVIVPLPKSDFPKTSLGKTLRPRMRRALESGEYGDILAATAAATTRQLGGFEAPNGPIETALTEIFAELFDLPAAEISVTASFFELGGTSLDILRLSKLVARDFDGRELPVIEILTGPTVRELAVHVAGGTGPRAYDPIVALQPVGDKTPLFCVHPGVGEVLVFVNLAKYFVGDRPFYALRARGFNPGEVPFSTFDEMVDTYVAAIRKRQPHGPYALAGYSYGGAVAFEIAKRLESAGERVDFVGSFNLPPHIKYRMDELDFVETATNLAMFLELVTTAQAALLPDRLRPLPKEEQLIRLLELAPAGRVSELDLDLTKFRAWAELAAGLTELGGTYAPSGNVRSMAVFYAIPLRGTKQDWLDKELRRWDDFSRETNSYIDVPGEHYTLMGPQHVASFQATLRKELDQALADADANRTDR
ncbi:alpha/beta fold hydrolase [Nocardia sp. NPDC059195]